MLDGTQIALPADLKKRHRGHGGKHNDDKGEVDCEQTLSCDIHTPNELVRTLELQSAVPVRDFAERFESGHEETS